MTEAMRSQLSMMFPFADRACSRKTGKIKDVAYDISKIKITNLNDGTVRISTTYPDYDIISGSFQVAIKQCETAVDDDFAKAIDVNATVPNELVLLLNAEQSAVAQSKQLCFRGSGLKGRLK